ncbi:hypothetical protein GCM10011352_01500 [Marinobacterium zhoushanense]|uniref:Outer membrane protein n=1 Tax=Marinobacterium zhoushanense TaxID=1679163 RepID=A0ABQ1JWS5_9GAMM|nr:OmpW family outer membrane protein [Marinobacterium zhoushanense]GGB79557.1 hypothetical protein GCM10011352_01500 [Marinobacterium zhoushanense]
MKIKQCSIRVALLTLATLCVDMAQAEDSPWSVFVGPAHIRFSTDAKAYANGTIISGGNGEASSNNGLSFGANYQIDPYWTARLTLGLPPTTTLRGTGTLASAGVLGKVTYGPAVLSVTRYLGGPAAIRPYLGVGVNYTLVTDTEDGAIADFKADSTYGAVLQGGIEGRVYKDFSLFLDVKKIYAKTTASGDLPAVGGAKASADITLDPLIISLGISKRF